MTTNLTTTNIGKEYQKELKKLSQSWGMSQTEFLNKAIWYFKKTGIDPNSSIFSPKEEIAKLEKRVNQVIQYISRQEKDKLNPLLDELIITERRLKESLALGIDKSDLEQIDQKIEKKSGEIFKVLTDIFENLNKDVSNLRQRLSSSMNESNRKIDQLNAKNKLVVELISLMFIAIKNRGITGKFNTTDINNFENALHKV